MSRAVRMAQSRPRTATLKHPRDSDSDVEEQPVPKKARVDTTGPVPPLLPANVKHDLVNTAIDNQFQAVKDYYTRCIDAVKNEFFVDVYDKDVPGWHESMSDKLLEWLEKENGYDIQGSKGDEDGICIKW